ncbi:MAG: hypothetical protein KDD15_34085, partial [Lewinella sp.]|nr:hypothetical protein [Lewinella sp.]
MTAYFQNPQVPYSLANNVIWQIMEDRSGIIWLVTSNGISRIHPDGNFYEYHDISHVEKGQIVGNQVKSLLISSTGAYWLATQNGVIRIDPVSGSKRLFSTTSAPDQQLLLNNVFALEEDRLGRIWIGTAGGLNIWDPTTQKMASVTADVSNGLNTNYIGNITNAAGEMWISAWEGGLYKVVDPSVGPPAIRFEKVPALNSDSEKIVYGDGAIWILEYQALYRVDPMSLRAESIPTFNEVSADQVIYAVYFSKAGHVWASTVNGLIQYFPEEEKGVFHQVFTGEDMIISSLVEDDAGNIWGASNSFILKVDPVSEQTEKYPLDKDLPLKSFYYGCAAKDEVGNLFFGGDNGYLTFSPDQVHSESFQPPVYITNIQVNNQDLSVSPSKREAGLQQDAAFTEILTLQYSQNNVTFEFSALNFRQPTLNTYAYRLAGLQEDWQYVSGNQNIAVYSNLPSGTYEFIVRAIDKDGMEADSSAVLQLTIKPPLWLSPWMLLLYALSIILIGYYTLRFYFGRLHLRNELKIVKLEKEHNEEVERIKEKFFTNISHELRTPISLILPPIRETLGKGTLDEHDRKLISLAEKNAIRLKRLVNQILDLNKLESESLQLKVEPAELVGYVREIGRLFVDHAERNHIDFRFESSIER